MDLLVSFFWRSLFSFSRGGLFFISLFISRCKGKAFRNIIQIFHYDSTTLQLAPTTLFLRSFLQLIVNYRLEYRKKYAKNFLVSIIILIFVPENTSYL